MSVIDVFNRQVSPVLNKTAPIYETWFGKSDFIPETVIIKSDDFNCGALCNELEFAREVTGYYVKSLDMAQAEGDNLELLINKFIDLPRRGSVESDEIYRKRFNFLTVANLNPSRCTKFAILSAIEYFINTVDSSVQVIEQFSTSNLYFQIRIEGVADTSQALTIGNNSFGFIDQFYLSGTSVGAVNTYLSELIQRIKACGVDYDVLFIEQYQSTKLSNAFIGVIQKYLQSTARIKAKTSFMKSSYATIV